MPTSPRPPLVVRHDGSTFNFKILQFPNMNFTGNSSNDCHISPNNMLIPLECKDELTTKFINDVLDVERPDLVLLCGGNAETVDADCRQAVIDYTSNPIEARNIPWAIAFDKQVGEYSVLREQISPTEAANEHSYFQLAPEDMDDIGDYELSVMDTTKSRAALRLYFMRSHARASPTDGGVHPSQIDFYRNLSDSHRNERVPAILFLNTPSVEFGQTRKNDLLHDQKALEGEMNETFSLVSVGADLLSTLVKQAEVKVVFVGHDQRNKSCIKHQGIQFCHGGDRSFGHAHESDPLARRARVIEWSQQDTGARTIRKWTLDQDSIHQVRYPETLYQDIGYAAVTTNTLSKNSDSSAAFDLVLFLTLAAVEMILGAALWNTLRTIERGFHRRIFERDLHRGSDQVLV